MPDPGSERGGISLGYVALIALVVGSLVVFNWSRFFPGPTPISPSDRSRLDAEVIAKIDEKLELAEADRKNARAHATLGLVYEANGLWQEAEQCFVIAERLDSTEPLWPFHRTRAMREMGQHAEALEVLIGIAPRLAEHAGPQYLLGVALVEVDRLEEGRAAFEKARRLQPNRPESYVALAGIENQVGRHDQAAKLLEKAIGLDANYKAAHFALGTAYRELGRLDEAGRELTLGVGAEPRMIPGPLAAEVQGYAVSFISEFTRAVEYIQSGRSREAVPVLEKLLRSHPEDTNVLNNLASAHERLYEHERAEELMREALRINDKEFATHINIAGVLFDQGRHAEALPFIDQSLELAPEVGQAHFIKSKILYAMGEYFASYQSLKNVVRTDPTNVLVHTALAETSLRMKRPEQATDHFATAIQRNPRDMQARVKLIQVQIQLGRKSAAAQGIAELEGVDPKNEELPGLKSLLEN